MVPEDPLSGQTQAARNVLLLEDGATAAGSHQATWAGHGDRDPAGREGPSAGLAWRPAPSVCGPTDGVLLYLVIVAR